ncbi:hypothetical protein MIMGU_mgv1a014560mg [Erythranthe guttata]|uniref:Mediator of RNA polymerase II transcription subunit 21 n=1 Tax=Erythranthe guttata TaxID=4155 RepID=A0A022QMU1_ERYGU|nr:hypothetical protein MIMGU_mgv1a014560mg [Erythranthe guttata]
MILKKYFITYFVFPQFISPHRHLHPRATHARRRRTRRARERRRRSPGMDIISQLQEQVNAVASIAFNTFGTLQRDAPPVQLSPNYPDPPANPNGVEDAATLAEQPKLLSAELVKAAKQFDALVAALPLTEGGEEAQLKRIAELQV